MTTIVTTAEIKGSARTTLLDELEAQPTPFELQWVSSRTYMLVWGGIETAVHIVLNDDGTWQTLATVEV